MKRVALFVLTNVAVVLTISVVLQLLGIERILDERGIGLDLGALLAMSLVVGMGGSLLSLALSKWSAKRLGRGVRAPRHGPLAGGSVQRELRSLR